MVCLVAWRRGDLRQLWTGFPVIESDVKNDEDDEEEYLNGDGNIRIS